MRLTPSDPDIQTLIGRIRDREIELQPEFQRGEVWSTAKKQRLVDSILRDWHIPPIHVIVDADTKQQLVLDGQQRLVAIRDFVSGLFPMDGRIEPLVDALRSQHGKRYSELPLELKRRFDQFTIRVFRITDYSSAEPGELFYRLNQPTALTAAEQRNAFFGETRGQIKSLVNALNHAGLDDKFWGFTNARMAYDDILSRAALYLEHNSLKKKVTAGTLADRFRSGAPFSADAMESLGRVIQLLREARDEMRGSWSLNKATAQSWLVFWCVADRLLRNELRPSLIGRFMSTFETRRGIYEIGLFDDSGPDGKHHVALLRSYEDRSTSRVADTLSVQIRDFVLWSWFLMDEPHSGALVQERSVPLRTLAGVLRQPFLEEWGAVDKLVASLNWGETLWQ